METLVEVPLRMVKDYLNELQICCTHTDRGCPGMVQLQHLDLHEAMCVLNPAVCSNEGCGEAVTKRDLIYHEREKCEFRKLKCHPCEETRKILVKMEENMVTMQTTITSIKTHMDASFNKVEEYFMKMAESVRQNTELMKIITQ